MSDSDVPVPVGTRRRFAAALAAAAAAPVLARALPLGAQVAPIQVPTPTPTPTPEPTPFVRSLAEAMQARFGKHLEPGQLEAAQRSLERIARNAERMKGVKLTNADEPDVVFFAAVAGAR